MPAPVLVRRRVGGDFLWLPAGSLRAAAARTAGCRAAGGATHQRHDPERREPATSVCQPRRRPRGAAGAVGADFPIATGGRTAIATGSHRPRGWRHPQFPRHRHPRDCARDPRHDVEAQFCDRSPRARHRLDRYRYAAAAFGLVADARDLAQSKRRDLGRARRGLRRRADRRGGGNKRRRDRHRRRRPGGSAPLHRGHGSRQGAGALRGRGRQDRRRPGGQCAARQRRRSGAANPCRPDPRFRHRPPGRPGLRPVPGRRQGPGQARHRVPDGLAGAGSGTSRPTRQRIADGPGQRDSRGVVAAALHRRRRAFFRPRKAGRGRHRAHLARLLRAERSEHGPRLYAAARLHAEQRDRPADGTRRHHPERAAVDDGGWRGRGRRNLRNLRRRRFGGRRDRRH